LGATRATVTIDLAVGRIFKGRIRIRPKDSITTAGVTGGADSFRRTAIIKSHIPHSDLEIILVKMVDGVIRDCRVNPIVVCIKKFEKGSLPNGNPGAIRDMACT
jgi:hypothetical protein